MDMLITLLLYKKDLLHNEDNYIHNKYYMYSSDNRYIIHNVVNKKFDVLHSFSTFKYKNNDSYSNSKLLKISSSK